MDYVLICSAALAASGLTLFSGFGLGTLLMPAFALFFPVEAAVAMTALVHFANNLFKLALMGRHADRGVALRFGLPALLAALAGAWLLGALSDLAPLFQYSAAGRIFSVTPVKLAMSFLMLGFALFEVLPRFQNLQVDPRYLPLGGALSGFFGGLSGHQGALRSAFLVRCGLSKESFIGTGVVIACFVDLSRLGIYVPHVLRAQGEGQWPLVAAATLSAFAGAFFGSRWLRKVTQRSVQVCVSLLLAAIAVLLGAGAI